METIVTIFGLSITLIACIVAIPIILIIVTILVFIFTGPSEKKKLNEMDQKINAYENKVFSTPEEKEKAKRQLKRELIELREKIVFKKKEAEDKISLL